MLRHRKKGLVAPNRPTRIDTTPPPGRGHRWFAATYDIVNRWAERRLLGALRRRIVGAASGRVLEIGAGTGANFPYYDATRVTRMIATEPDPSMLERAARRTRQLRLPISLVQSAAESLPFASSSFDTVVATLVFCTIADPRQALVEVHRVLAPGGTFRFIEHVRAHGPVASRVQSRLGAGCHLNRRTAESIAAAGFEIVELEQQAGGILPIIAGWARRVEDGGNPESVRDTFVG